MTDGVTAHVTADSRGQYLVLTDAGDMDAAQASGRWLKTTAAAEVRA